ncbi:plastocyanin/azurin family copper-binding protein [Halobacteriaceae archaeon SHR40]|uniref:plastocyanin/azurin family copper-binding protein n=1 Tax=Halovenus amylolytica TaxID=2500550 RepID=UPI000FE2C753
MPPSRRAILAACATSVSISVAGCFGQEDVEFDDEVPEPVADHLSSANNVDGSITDRTGESELVVAVGPGGNLAYDPALVRIDPGTRVIWEWESNGHTVTSSDGTFDIDTAQESTGYEVSSQFDQPGEYLYECRPHSAAGHRGAVIVD